MNILQGVKPNPMKVGMNRFIIKSKQSIKELRNEQIQSNMISNEQDIVELINYLIQRSRKINQLLESRKINNQEFYQKHLFGSACIRTLIKTILDKMMSERRLGKHLKGMNKSNMNEIEKIIWNCLERQIEIYKNQIQYQKMKRDIETDIEKHKESILKDIQNVKKRKRDLEDNKDEQLCRNRDNCEESNCGRTKDDRSNDDGESRRSFGKQNDENFRKNQCRDKDEDAENIIGKHNCSNINEYNSEYPIQAQELQLQQKVGVTQFAANTYTQTI